MTFTILFRKVNNLNSSQMTGSIASIYIYFLITAEQKRNTTYKFLFLNSSTALFAALAVIAIKVKVGFWVLVLVIHAPSLTKTFLQACN